MDDDNASRLLACKTLEKSGFAVSQAVNGYEAVSVFEQQRPDLVLMDVMMPGVDGFAACRRIRQLRNGTLVPIIMVTALDDLESIEHAYDAGATDFITKPIQWAILHHRVRYMARQKFMGDQLRKSEERLVKAQRLARIGNWEWDFTSDRMRWSDTVYDIFGMRPYDFDGSMESFLQCIHPEDRQRVEQVINDVLSGSAPEGTDYRVLIGGREASIVHQETELELDQQGHAVKLVGTVQDVTERREAENRIRYLNLHDPLTSLPNRKYFHEQLEAALQDAAGKKNRRTAVLTVGLDRFRRINATFGRDSGDDLLCKAADRLEQFMNQCPALSGKGTPPLLSRFGGDEFAILLTNIGSVQRAAKVASYIIDGMAEAFHVGGQEVYITTSIGIALHPDDETTSGGLLLNAEAALRHAKGQGKNNYQFYTTAMNANAVRRLSLESKLQKALDNNELVLYYQPKVDISSGHMVGMEALVRWRHPELGMVTPDEFIDLAEETGLIVPIGLWVLREACNQNRAWQERGLMPLQVSVNLSPRQFWQEDLAACVGEVLVESGLDPRYLELEITEGTFMQNAEETIATLSALKEMDLTLSVDDFGTGYSSLSYLQRFPLDSLKVDRSFVTDITTNPDSAVITRTIISMAKSLNLKVIAEGVETVEQLEFLRAEGCQLIQGYLCSPPVSAKEFTRLLQQGNAPLLTPAGT